MLKPVSNQNYLLTCSADCPADNHARQLAQFLYGTLPTIMKNTLTFILLTLIFLCSCNKPKQKTTDNTPISDYYSSDYIAFQGKDNFEVINIDSLSNFSDLSITIDEMNCDNKIPVRTFALDKYKYNFVGC